MTLLEASCSVVTMYMLHSVLNGSSWPTLSLKSKLPSVPMHLSCAEARGWAFTEKRLVGIYLLPYNGLSECPFPSRSWTDHTAVVMGLTVQPMK